MRLMVSCAECGTAMPANKDDDGSIRALGVSECPDCGSTDFEEVSL